MKKLLSKFDDLMAAVTFAEAGEHETARQIMKESDKRRPVVDEKCPHCGGALDIDCMPEPHKV